MRVQFRPTVASDIAKVTSEPLPHRIRAVTATLAGEVIGVGGIGHRPDGTVIAFAHLTETMRQYPAAVHRAGHLGMALIRASGVPLVVAQAQSGNPAAERWLLRFGFRPVTVDGNTAYVWERNANVSA